jgi:alpha-amylase/alpha-mannosidase (GH57 family)
MLRMTKVAFLWHMHQPHYGDAVTGEQLLPWVRLHALKDYFGMAELLREFPKVRLTFNLVPSLLAQLDALAAGHGHDRYFHLAMKPAAELTPDDRAFIVANFFLAPRHRMIDPYPRYAELLIRREEEPGRNGEERWRRASTRFSEHDLRDLQVWEQLVWIDPLYWNDPRVQALFSKGRDFTEADKKVLAEVEREILRRVIPAYREAEARGQVELSTSAYYHPILPLLCDTDIYAQMHPGAHVPTFRRAEDAEAQLLRAVECHEHFFHAPPAGMWPPEGSVSEAVVPLANRAGLRWMATDEAILGKTLRMSFTRDGAGQLDQPEVLYRPYRVRIGNAEVRCLFRDHVLSDLIGFTYSSWNSEAAARDLVGRLAEAGRRFRHRTGGEEATIAVVLDGENAWEHFEGDGRPFLRALYGMLSDDPELRTVTMSEATAEARETLHHLSPGSWAMGDFYIWIGHTDDRKGWSQLAEVRRVLDEARTVVPCATYAEALEHAYVAEGSDWFWWYGDDHSSEQDLEFDILFRSHVRRVYEILGRAVPDDLFVTNITEGVKQVEIVQPLAPLQVKVDGRVTSEGEWASAGYPVLKRLFGTMRQVSEQDDLRVREIRFGFDADTLYVRVDLAEPTRQALADGIEFDLAFVDPPGLRVAIAGQNASPSARLLRREASGTWTPVDGVKPPAVAADRVLEVGVPLAAFGGCEVLSFFVAVTRAGVEITRYPSYAPIATRPPKKAGG